ncbi:hypothetical protein [Vibrio phage vB_VneS_J26]
MGWYLTILGILAVLAILALLAVAEQRSKDKDSAPGSKILRTQLLELEFAARDARYSHKRIEWYSKNIDRSLSSGDGLQAYNWLRLFRATLSLYEHGSIDWTLFTGRQQEQIVLEAYHTAMVLTLTRAEDTQLKSDVHAAIEMVRGRDYLGAEMRVKNINTLIKRKEGLL